MAVEAYGIETYKEGHEHGREIERGIDRNI